MTVVTPTDSPKSVCNHCVIDLFGDVFVSSLSFLNFVGIGAFGRDKCMSLFYSENNFCQSGEGKEILIYEVIKGYVGK